VRGDWAKRPKLGYVSRSSRRHLVSKHFLSISITLYLTCVSALTYSAHCLVFEAKSVRGMVEATTAALTARAKELDLKRNANEQRLLDIEAELDSMPGAPGLKGKLVDDEVSTVYLRPEV
jgi:hypothetical protein